MRHGNIFGSLVGPIIGNYSDPSNPMASVTRDATSLKYVPANATEWAATLAASGVSSGGPIAAYQFQEASGNPADSIGSFTLTASGTNITYQTAVSGWTRKGIKFTNAGTGVFTSTNAGLPDVSSTSCLILLYVSIAAPTSSRGMLSMGTTQMGVEITSTPNMGIIAGSTVVGSANPTGVRLIWLRRDRNANTDTYYSDQELLNPTVSGTATGKQILFGATNGLLCPTATVLYAAVFSGTAAQLSNAQLKTIAQTLGWTMAV